MRKLILITNPGSASRKYALYDGEQLLVKMHFEFEGDNIVCTLSDENGRKEKEVVKIKTLNEAVGEVDRILHREHYLSDKNKLAAAVIRVVAPGDFFVTDHVVDDEFMRQLEIAAERNPVHVPNTKIEISCMLEVFKDTKIIAVSDSASIGTSQTR